MSSLELTPPIFSILSGLIEETFGLHYGSSERELLRDKVAARAEQAGFQSLLDYYYFLRYDPAGTAELTELAEHLVVNETYFFREWRSIEVLVDSFLAPWCAEGRRPRIWSAACATGEEPLSLAMLLAERGLLDKVEIVATDISARVLSKPKAGLYGKRSVRQLPQRHLVDRFLSREEDAYRVSPELVQAIRWKNVNLMIDAEVAALGVFDVILCRNVLIYFSDATVRAVLGRLATALRDDGVLLVGVSESLMRYGNGFFGEEHGGSFVYRKAER